MAVVKIFLWSVMSSLDKRLKTQIPLNFKTSQDYVSQHWVGMRPGQWSSDPVEIKYQTTVYVQHRLTVKSKNTGRKRSR